MCPMNTQETDIPLYSGTTYFVRHPLSTMGYTQSHESPIKEHTSVKIKPLEMCNEIKRVVSIVPVTIILRYIFMRFWDYYDFTGIIFCYFYV